MEVIRSAAISELLHKYGENSVTGLHDVHAIQSRDPPKQTPADADRQQESEAPPHAWSKDSRHRRRPGPHFPPVLQVVLKETNTRNASNFRDEMTDKDEDQRRPDHHLVLDSSCSKRPGLDHGESLSEVL
jgi:hypothetical protein